VGKSNQAVTFEPFTSNKAQWEDDENEFDFGFDPQPPSKRSSMIDAVGVLQDYGTRSSSRLRDRAKSMDVGEPTDLPARQRGLTRTKSIDHGTADLLAIRRSFR
jgi:hypothetical protein